MSVDVTRLLAGVSGLLLATAALSAQAPSAQAPAAPASEIDAHINAAKTAAGLDYRATFVNLCLPGANPALANPAARAGGARGGQAAAAPGRQGGGAGRGPGTTPDRATWYASPYKIFDNFYWLGTRQHSSWALRTSEGLIILDTNFAWATEPEIIDGLKTLGLDARQIKYVVISHAHGDHDQGAAELQKRFGAKVVMGAADWDATLQRPATAAGGVPTKDISVGPAGYKLTLGDTTIDIVSTPGHSPGTISYVFPVKDQGRTVTVAYSGGTLTGAFGTNAARWDEYIDSQKRIAKAAADAGATVILSNHSEYDNAYTKARLIAARREPGENHPFITNAVSVQRYFTVMTECAAASKLRVGAK